MNYYNTTNKSGEDLKESFEKARTQEEKVLLIFQADSKGLTPSIVWRRGFDTTKTPLTSIRRAISNLTRKGSLKKLERQERGVYGDKEHVWCAV